MTELCGKEQGEEKTIVTNIPDSDPVKLTAWYNEFEGYYPNCEMETKGWFVHNAKPDWVYVDAGANIGYYSILFSRLSPHGKIYAFEPTATYDMLRANLEYNKVKNVETFRLALGKDDGEMEENIFRIWGKEAERLVYRFTTIDTFVQEHGISRVDAIKIDVDSFDFEVLQGGVNIISRFDPFIVFEVNPEALSKRNVKPHEIFDYLHKKHGYDCYYCYDKENFLIKKEFCFQPSKEHPVLPLVWPDREKETIDGLGHRLTKNIPQVHWPDTKNMPPVPDINRDTLDDAPCLRYLFHHFKPSRHLEFGTWKGEGVMRVLEECDAHVWTLNLYEGETAENGGWSYSEKMTADGGTAQIVRKGLYVRTDAEGMIGRLYLEAGTGHRVDQIYADSREWDDGAYPDGFFDSVFVDGGHDAMTSRSDLYKALRLLRPGGLLLLHDFCPDPETNMKYSSTIGVTSMVFEERERLISMCDDLFWIKGTWLLCGIRRGAGDSTRDEEERGWFLEIKERTLKNVREERAKKSNSPPKTKADRRESFVSVLHKKDSDMARFMFGCSCVENPDASQSHAGTQFFPLPYCGNIPQNIKLISKFPEETTVFLVQVQDSAYTTLAEFDIGHDGAVFERECILYNDPGEIRLVFYVPRDCKNILTNAPVEIKVLSNAVSAEFLRGLNLFTQNEILSTENETLSTENETLQNHYNSLLSSFWGKTGRTLGFIKKETK